jgi:hypothetical protein
MKRNDIVLEYARQHASHRLFALQTEERQILKLFPDAKPTASTAFVTAATAAAQDSPRTNGGARKSGGRKWSAAQRKAASIAAIERHARKRKASPKK